MGLTDEQKQRTIMIDMDTFIHKCGETCGEMSTAAGTMFGIDAVKPVGTILANFSAALVRRLFGEPEGGEENG